MWRPRSSCKPDAAIRRVQDTYTKNIKPIRIVANRRKTQEAPITEPERSQLRPLLGSLQWRGTQTAPWLQAELSILLGRVGCALVSDLSEAKKLLKLAQRTESLAIPIHPHRGEIAFVGYTDASWGGRADGHSQGGFRIFMYDLGYLQGKPGPLTLISWDSHKLTRICRSSLAAEIQGIADGLGELDFVRLAWWEIVW